MAEFEYLEHTFDFHYKVGDFVDSYYLEPKDGDTVSLDKLDYAMMQITEVDAVDEVREVCIVKGPEGLIKTVEDGTIMCPKIKIHGYGFIVLATENGTMKLKCLVPEHGKEKVQFVMTKLVARPL